MPHYYDKLPAAPYSIEHQRWRAAVMRGDNNEAANWSTKHAAKFGNTKAIEHYRERKEARKAGARYRLPHINAVN